MKKICQAFKRYFQTMPRHMKVLMAAILLFSLSILTMRAVIGKYVFTKATAGTFVAGAQLAESFRLQEHEAVQAEDGHYTLGSAVVTTNTYKLIPGLTIPKDPYVSIIGKTDIDAYLYLEVIEDSLAAQLTYEIDDTTWTLLSGMTGPHGGALYTYAAGLVNDQSTGLDHIPVLKNNSFSLTPIPVTGSTEALKFCGFLVEPTGAEATAAAAFTGKFAAVTP